MPRCLRRACPKRQQEQLQTHPPPDRTTDAQKEDENVIYYDARERRKPPYWSNWRGGESAIYSDHDEIFKPTNWVNREAQLDMIESNAIWVRDTTNKFTNGIRDRIQKELENLQFVWELPKTQRVPDEMHGRNPYSLLPELTKLRELVVTAGKVYPYQVVARRPAVDPLARKAHPTDWGPPRPHFSRTGVAISTPGICHLAVRVVYLMVTRTQMHLEWVERNLQDRESADPTCASWVIRMFVESRDVQMFLEIMELVDQWHLVTFLEIGQCWPSFFKVVVRAFSQMKTPSEMKQLNWRKLHSFIFQFRFIINRFLSRIIGSSIRIVYGERAHESDRLQIYNANDLEFAFRSITAEDILTLPIEQQTQKFKEYAVSILEIAHRQSIKQHQRMLDRLPTPVPLREDERWYQHFAGGGMYHQVPLILQEYQELFKFLVVRNRWNAYSFQT